MLPLTCTCYLRKKNLGWRRLLRRCRTIGCSSSMYSVTTSSTGINISSSCCCCCCCCCSSAKLLRRKSAKRPKEDRFVATSSRYWHRGPVNGRGQMHLQGPKMLWPYFSSPPLAQRKLMRQTPYASTLGGHRRSSTRPKSVVWRIHMTNFRDPV